MNILSEKQPERLTAKKAESFFLLLLSSLAVGMAAGMLDAFFGITLLHLDAYRTAHSFLIIPFLPLAGIMIIIIYQQWGKNCLHAIDNVFMAAGGQEGLLPWRIIPLCAGTAWLTHLFGGSAGRIGAAIPIGAVLASHMKTLIHGQKAMHVLLIAGMAGGFSGLFQTPAAAVFFAMEILASNQLEKDALIPALAASWSASLVSSAAGMPRLEFIQHDIIAAHVGTLCTLAACGLLFGAAGGSFAWSLSKARQWLSRSFPSPYKRIFLCGAAVAFLSLLLRGGRYSGLSLPLITAAFTGGLIYPADWIAKYMLTIITRAGGFQGGELMPVLCIGASLGVLLTPLTGLPSGFMAACGVIGVFTGATDTLLAPVCFGMELFGWHDWPWFLIICIMAKSSNFNQGLYTLQKKNSFFRFIR